MERVHVGAFCLEGDGGSASAVEAHSTGASAASIILLLSFGGSHLFPSILLHLPPSSLPPSCNPSIPRPSCALCPSHLLPPTPLVYSCILIPLIQGGLVYLMRGPSTRIPGVAMMTAAMGERLGLVAMPICSCAVLMASTSALFSLLYIQHPIS